MSFVKKILRKNLMSENLNKIDQCLYQIVLFVVRKNKLSLKIKTREDYWEHFLHKSLPDVKSPYLLMIFYRTTCHFY